jgi:hypothetical protein
MRIAPVLDHPGCSTHKNYGSRPGHLTPPFAESWFILSPSGITESPGRSSTGRAAFPGDDRPRFTRFKDFRASYPPLRVPPDHQGAAESRSVVATTLLPDPAQPGRRRCQAPGGNPSGPPGVRPPGSTPVAMPAGTVCWVRLGTSVVHDAGPGVPRGTMTVEPGSPGMEAEGLGRPTPGLWTLAEARAVRRMVASPLVFGPRMPLRGPVHKVIRTTLLHCGVRRDPAGPLPPPGPRPSTGPTPLHRRRRARRARERGFFPAGAAV